MDAVKFVKEYIRMCAQPFDCEECPVYKTDFCTAPTKERSQEGAEEVVQIVEEWSAAHPRKTRQDIFLEQWPNAQLDAQGTITVCPRDLCKGAELSRLMEICVRTSCYDCRRMFWKKVVE